MSGFEIELPSSPDPLGDEAAAPNAALAPPSTVRPTSTSRRFLHSAASSRFSALPGTSPRKRMFALDVGSEITPQTIYVTVEAGQDGVLLAQNQGGPSVNRRLFGSPTPQPSPNHRIRTTTTTIPLKGLTDDEGDETPRPRRRRSSGRLGTPAATPGTKGRKARNPTPRSTKKLRATPVPSSDILQSETPAPSGQSTAKRRPGRPPKRKPTDAPSEGGDTDLTGRSPKKRRGRRRQSLAPEEIALLSTANNVKNKPTEIARSKSPESAQTSGLRPATVNDGNVRENRAQTGDEEGEEENDIWMASGDNPSAQTNREENDGLFTSAHTAPPDRSSPLLGSEGNSPARSDDYALIMEHDDRSDIESQNSADQMDTDNQSSRSGHREPLPDESDEPVSIRQSGEQYVVMSHDGDTRSKRGSEADRTVDPESFTMIDIESMPSFRHSRNSLTSDPPEIGENTSFFINKTLDSLREEIAKSDDDDDVDILVSSDEIPAESRPSIRTAKAPSTDNQVHSTRSPTVGSLLHMLESHERTISSNGLAAEDEPPHSVHTSASTKESLNGTDRWRGKAEAEYEDDSFSDIPEEALAIAESQEELQPTSPRATENPAETAEQNNTNEAINYFTRHSHRIEDQTSSRPISRQSTPSPVDQVGVHDDNDSPQRSAPSSIGSRRASGQQAMQKSSPPHSIRSRSDSNRLLTPPDEAPSSTRSSASDGAAITEDRRDLTSDDIGSSPPEVATFNQYEPPILPSRRKSDTPTNRQTTTGAEQMQERQPFALVLQPTHLGVGGPRPALSPVVRIGRTLQNILSDPPSPSARSSVLGSPFKGSVRHSSPLDGAAVDEALQNVVSANDSLLSSIPQSASQPGQNTMQQTSRTWTMAFAPLSQIKNLVSQGAQLFTSPHIDKPQASDPFGPSSPTMSKRPDSTRNSSFLDRIKQASREGSAYSSKISIRERTDNNGEHHRIVHMANDVFSRTSESSHLPSADKNGSSSRAQQSADKAAGWDGTYEPDADDNGGPQLKATQEIGQLSAESVECERDMIEENTYYIPQDDNGHPEQAGQSAAEERLQSGEGQATEEQSEEEDIWTIEANRTASSPRYPVLPDETINSFRKSGLSIDWGTRSTGSLRNSHSAPDPALKTGHSAHVNTSEDLEDYSLLDVRSDPSTQLLSKKATPQPQKQPKRVDLSDFFSSSPNFLERQRRAKQARLAKPFTVQPNADVVQSASLGKTNEMMDPIEGIGSSFTRPSPEFPSPATVVSDNANGRPASCTPFNAITERNSISRPSEKNFTPQHENNDAKLFESWAVSSQAPTSEPATSDPPRVTQPDIPQGAEDSDFDTPDLRPLPGRAASPSKSCLRSPLKPKMPGRVVDFTSSAMSTTQPLQARTRNNRGSTISKAEPVLPGTHPTGKENENDMLNHTSHPSSPRHKQMLEIQRQQQWQYSGSPLSQTRWSRKHWLLLDNLLQSYRRNPLEFQLLHSDAIMTSPHKRPSSKLLGKNVTSQGESLVLEQCHLDVTDSFIKEVGGWPEEAIAKRLFALIVGEKRRRLGVVPKRH